MKALTDDELMQEIAKGSHKAFNLLFGRHAGHFLGYAKRLLKDRNRAEDITQEIWLKVVKLSTHYELQGHFVAWVYTMIRNECFTNLKKAKRFSSIEDEDIKDIPDYSFEQDFLNKHELQKVHAAIEHLPEMQRLVLLAWTIEDMSYEDLARTFDCSLSSIKSLLFRARTNLEKTLRNAV